MSKHIAIALLVVVAPVAFGCSGATTSPPAPASAEPAPVEEEPTEPAPEGLEAFTEAEIQTLFDRRCVKCHGPSNALLDLSAPFTRETVGIATNTGGGQRGFCASSEHGTRIVPGDRAASLLWHKVKGSHDCGSPMPYDKGNKKLSATELERLGLWIDGLAKNE